MRHAAVHRIRLIGPSANDSLELADILGDMTSSRNWLWDIKKSVGKDY